MRAAAADAGAGAKHVTVNDALLRLDGQGGSGAAKPEPRDPPKRWWTAVLGVPAGAVNAWEGQGGKSPLPRMAADLVAPAYCRAMIADQGAVAIHDGPGSRWSAPSRQHGAGMMARQMSEDLTLGAGAFQTVDGDPFGAVISDGARAGRAITGSATSWTDGAIRAPPTASRPRFGQGRRVVGRGHPFGADDLLGPGALVLTTTGGSSRPAGPVVLHWWELHPQLTLDDSGLFRARPFR